MADFPDSTIDRKTLLPQLFPNPENYLLLAGLAGTAKDSAAWTQEADNLITLGGAMGAAVSMGLGMVSDGAMVLGFGVRGWLAIVYRKFTSNHTGDPTGSS